MNNKIIVCLSGGLDSTVLLHYLKKDNEIVGALSVDYGSKHNKKEIEMAKLNCQQLGIAHYIIEFDFIKKFFKSCLINDDKKIPEGYYTDKNMAETVVPFRNAIILSIATGLAESLGADHIAIANHAGDHAIYPDCREDFIINMQKAIYYGTANNISLIAPFTNITKSDIVYLGKKISVDFNNTYSCYNGRDLHCGKCGTCVERKEAFE